MRIAFLHLAPVAADPPRNRRLIEDALALAARKGAEWVLTPELCVTGYTFADRLGTRWIEPAPDPWMTDVGAAVARLGVTLFLSHPERDPATGALRNSLFVIGPDGRRRGGHRKVNTLPTGSEAWSTPGTLATPVAVEPVGPVGLLICADAYSPWIAKSLHAQGARLLVCNRTGPDHILDFRAGASVVVEDGARLLELQAPDSTVFLLDWDLDAQRPAGAARAIPLG